MQLQIAASGTNRIGQALEATGMARIEKTPDLALVATQTGGERDIGQTGHTLSDIERQLGCGQRRRRNQALASPFGGGRRHIETPRDTKRQGLVQAVARRLQRRTRILTEGDGTGQIAKSDRDFTPVLGTKGGGISDSGYSHEFTSFSIWTRSTKIAQR
jgi:hypothetical protein